MPRSGPRKVRRYSDEFKLTAVRLSQQPGMQVQTVAAALEIHPFMLSKWRKDARDGMLRRRAAPAPPAGPTRELAAFRTLELDAGVSIEEGDVILERSASGLGVSGSGKGYRYHRGPMPLTPLCPSLDRPLASDPGSGNGLCFKSLRDGWCLFYSQS